MKKIICVFVSAFLCACAGNPPAWWNPSGRYTQDTSSNTTVAPASTQTTITPKPTLEVPTEETFTPEESSFEEMALTPPAAESLENAVESLQPSILEE